MEVTYLTIDAPKRPRGPWCGKIDFKTPDEGCVFAGARERRLQGGVGATPAILKAREIPVQGDVSLAQHLDAFCLAPPPCRTRVSWPLFQRGCRSRVGKGE